MRFARRRLATKCVCFGLVALICVPDAAAWGPRARKAIAMGALQLVRTQDRYAYKSPENNYEADLLRGAEDGFEQLRASIPMQNEEQATGAVFHQIMLLRSAKEKGMGSYFAYRMGVLGALSASIIVPYGVPFNEEDAAMKEKLIADLATMTIGFTFTQRSEPLTYIRSVDTYFHEKRMFYGNDRQLIADDYRAGRGKTGFLAQAAQTYFDRSVDAVADSWFTVFRRAGESTDMTLSPKILADYFVQDVGYLLSVGKNFRQAELTYRIFEDINPPDNVEAFETLGDMFYAFGETNFSVEAKERGVREWQRAYQHPGPQRQRASKKLAEHFITAGEDYYRKQPGEDDEDYLKLALQSFQNALQFERTNDIAASRITETTKAIKERDERYELQLAVIDNAALGIAEAERSRIAENYADALTTYNQVLNGLGVVAESEFRDLSDRADETANTVNKARNEIYDAVLDRADQFMDTGDRAIEERRFDEALGSYALVDSTLSTIPTEEGSSNAERKAAAIEAAQTKIAEANTAKERFLADQAAAAEAAAAAKPKS